MKKKYESFRHLFKRFVQTADSFKNEPSASLYDWLLNHWFDRYIASYVNGWNTAYVTQKCATNAVIFVWNYFC